jgi:superfamily II DNA/RNA helicase
MHAHACTHAHTHARALTPAHRFRILDECDEMLNMGFVDDVERILGTCDKATVQTMLFSATLPAWVKDITRRFLKPDHATIDLVGTEKMKVGGEGRGRGGGGGEAS